MSVRTRFPPSPTGHLHIGSARTALFNWLYARHHGGAFVLRFEDTDRERSTQESVDEILDAMRWLGLDWDEGPFFQSERYAPVCRVRRAPARSRIASIAAGARPRSSRRVAPPRSQAGRPPAYDRTCRDLIAPPAGRTSHTLRFRAPVDGETVIDDLVKGPIVFHNAELDDFIILRSDGSPVYNFCVVVDDVDMRITHVIRGDDHVANTPRQILLYQALDASLPRFAHAPMILGPDKARLSKRHGATSVFAVSRPGLPAGRARELPRPARLVARRSGDLHPRGAGAALLARARRQVGGRLQRREAPVAELPVPEGDAGGGACRVPSARFYSRRACRCPRIGRG